MHDLKDKKILVTGGGGTGVASGICKVLDYFGARLILNEIKEKSLLQQAEEKGRKREREIANKILKEAARNKLRKGFKVSLIATVLEMPENFGVLPQNCHLI